MPRRHNPIALNGFGMLQPAGGYGQILCPEFFNLANCAANEKIEANNTTGVVLSNNALATVETFVVNISKTELNTQANAAAPNATEANSTTGISAGNLVVRVESTFVNTGTYAVEIEANGTPTSGANASIDLDASPFSLVDGTIYTLRIEARHVGTGDNFRMGLESSPTQTSGTLIKSFGVGDTTYIEYEVTFTHGSGTRYLAMREFSINNDGGIYIDNLSVKEFTAALEVESNTTPTNSAAFTIDLNQANIGLTVGQTYTLSADVRHVGSGGNWRLALGSTSAGSGNDGGDIISPVTSAMVTYITYSIEFEHSSNSRYLSGRESSGTDNGGLYIDNITIKQC